MPAICFCATVPSRLGRNSRAKTGGRQKTRIFAFIPRNIIENEGGSSGEEFASWGPDLAWPAIVASNWQPILFPFPKGEANAKTTSCGKNTRTPRKPQRTTRHRKTMHRQCGIVNVTMPRN